MYSVVYFSRAHASQFRWVFLFIHGDRAIRVVLKTNLGGCCERLKRHRSDVPMLTAEAKIARWSLRIGYRCFQVIDRSLELLYIERRHIESNDPLIRTRVSYKWLVITSIGRKALKRLPEKKAIASRRTIQSLHLASCPDSTILLPRSMHVSSLVKSAYSGQTTAQGSNCILHDPCASRRRIASRTPSRELAHKVSHIQPRPTRHFNPLVSFLWSLIYRPTSVCRLEGKRNTVAM